ncbi:MAG: DNA polymerase IV [Deltaproteobacteria bacterium]|nr:DNA polymerase IV [Deltaproteobacteria bacterium]
MPHSPRTILHVDLDAFYASVEQRDDPALRGKPVIVGGSVRRGVVCAASYEARRFGVRSAMPMATAVRLCPQARVLRPRMGDYARVSGQFFDVLHSYSPLVEGLSLDEAFLDVTGEERLFGDGAAIAQLIKRRVKGELELVASVGVAPSKFLAKIASDLRKPDGLVVVAPGEVRAFLHPLPIGRLWGVGKVTEEKLARLGLRTIGDVARIGEQALAAHVGNAQHLVGLARGEDDRDVVPERDAGSIGHEDTFDSDIRDREELKGYLLDQADRACARLRSASACARVVTLKIKYADHRRTTRRLTLPRPTADGRLVGDVLQQLLEEVPDIETRGVRLTGVSLSDLRSTTEPAQLTLPSAVPDGEERGARLGEAIDQITARFGSDALRRAVHLHKRR